MKVRILSRTVAVARIILEHAERLGKGLLVDL